MRDENDNNDDDGGTTATSELGRHSMLLKYKCNNENSTAAQTNFQLTRFDRQCRGYARGIRHVDWTTAVKKNDMPLATCMDTPER
jgi:hypothetical protein